MTKYTPEPWNILLGFDGRHPKYVMLNKSTSDFHVSYDEVEFNRYLIEAAPDLLKALEEIVECQGALDYGPCYKCAYQGGLAIAKAKGELSE